MGNFKCKTSPISINTSLPYQICKTPSIYTPTTSRFAAPTKSLLFDWKTPTTELSVGVCISRSMSMWKTTTFLHITTHQFQACLYCHGNNTIAQVLFFSRELTQFSIHNQSPDILFLGYMGLWDALSLFQFTLVFENQPFPSHDQSIVSSPAKCSITTHCILS